MLQFMFEQFCECQPTVGATIDQVKNQDIYRAQFRGQQVQGREGVGGGRLEGEAIKMNGKWGELNQVCMYLGEEMGNLTGRGLEILY